mgnify:CR=1 FL=1
MFNIDSVDFREVANKVNYITLNIDSTTGASLVDKSIDQFTVVIDMSDKEMKTLDKNPSEIVFISQDEKYNYNVNFEKSELDSIVIMGPNNELQNITAEDIRVDIDVSSLDPANSAEQMVEVKSITITPDDVKGCWAYGKYNAYITIEPKGE